MNGHQMIDKARADIADIEKYARQASTPEELELCRKTLFGVLESYRLLLDQVDRLV